jgi:peptidylprolyl isomerase
MRSCAPLLAVSLLLAFPLAGCGRDPEPIPAPVSPSLPVPRTVEKGDGCTVEITENGAGAVANFGDEVALTCEARVKDSEAKFLSTAGWDVPLRIRIGDPAVLPGLSRGLLGLSAGTRARIEVPPALAYGEKGSQASGIPADATLVFDVEVLGVRP